MDRKYAVISLLVIPFLAIILISCVGESDKEERSADKARRTVTDFLELCKQGKGQEASQRYMDFSQGLPDEYYRIPGVANYDIESVTCDATSHPVATVTITTYALNTYAVNELSLTITCREDGKFIISIEPNIQPASEEQARQTVTDFLEMCRLDQVDEALEMYCDRMNMPGGIPQIPSPDKFVGYAVYGVTSCEKEDSTIVVVDTGLCYNDYSSGVLENVGSIFQLSQDGTTILSNDPGIELKPEEQARLTVSGFLEMCRQDRITEAVARYVAISDEHRWHTSSSLNNLLDYRIDSSAYAEDPAPLIQVFVSTSAYSPGSDLVFYCSEDGKFLTGCDGLYHVAS